MSADVATIQSPLCLDGCAGLSGNTNVAMFFDWIKTHVPDVLTEQPEPDDPSSGSNGPGLGLNAPGEIDGLGPRWESVGGPGASLGCDSTGGSAHWLALLFLPLLARRR